ncbi:MAG: urea ABC transporter ATP-binding subunit UrtE [Candidatus Acididesulfobacter diazotrophicus]|jgi:urea transport system ATP-binding protein|uniref:Urea ABC transporter ATP-binding subunit UrtE n=1 Tax=Candidatus Acididesulfobacter diazotrophicus TaxID=2597226 RepID=A0A519BMP0_9DELT|nr:MAG: urea ABC transporter ATP-binding subunit UrtE [Candidatus Acididesulfobacter diazotrophicus]
MLNIKCINAGYKDTQILRDVDLEIPKGSVVALMGRNGVGKTTFLKTIIGLINVKSGTISFNDEDITHISIDKRARKGISYVPQGREIFPYLTVYENIILGFEAKHNYSNEMLQRIYEMFPFLKKMLNKNGGELSGGQQQQLAIARALASNPDLILMDEPTEGIQPSIVLEIENIIKLIKGQKTTSILLVEQYMDFALRLSDYCYVMEKGTIVFRSDRNKFNKDDIKKYLTI